MTIMTALVIPRLRMTEAGGEPFAVMTEAGVPRHRYFRTMLQTHPLHTILFMARDLFSRPVFSMPWAGSMASQASRLIEASRLQLRSLACRLAVTQRRNGTGDAGSSLM